MARAAVAVALSAFPMALAACGAGNPLRRVAVGAERISDTISAGRVDVRRRTSGRAG